MNTDVVYSMNYRGIHSIIIITKNTTHYTLHTTHYTLHTTHYTLHTTHYTLHTTHFFDTYKPFFRIHTHIHTLIYS